MTVKVSAVLYFRVVDPSRAVTEVANYLFATMQLAQTTLRSVGGQTELDELLSQRDKLNARIQEIVDSQTEPWGVKVTLVELKNMDLPQKMQRAIAAQAEAERERRAKVIAAEGEFQAAQRLAEAAEIWVRVRSRFSFATCKRSRRSRPIKFHHGLSAADRSVRAVSRVCKSRSRERGQAEELKCQPFRSHQTEFSEKISTLWASR